MLIRVNTRQWLPDCYVEYFIEIDWWQRPRNAVSLECVYVVVRTQSNINIKTLKHIGVYNVCVYRSFLHLVYVHRSRSPRLYLCYNVLFIYVVRRMACGDAFKSWRFSRRMYIDAAYVRVILTKTENQTKTESFALVYQLQIFQYFSKTISSNTSIH